jgi:hypothetical protein
VARNGQARQLVLLSVREIRPDLAGLRTLVAQMQQARATAAV